MSQLTERLDRFESRLHSMESELRELRRLASAEERAPEPEPALWEVLGSEPVVTPPPPPPRPEPEVEPAPEQRRAPRRQFDFSVLFGARALAWTGGAVTLLGIVFFFVLAVERGWIGEGARVLLGALASTACVAAGVWLRGRFGDTYASVSAAGAGIAGFFATLLAATALYDLVPRPAALVAAAAIAAVGTALAVWWGSQTMATLGLLGANLVPLPIAIQDDHLSAIGVGFAALVFAAVIAVTVPRGWRELLTVSSVATLAEALGLVAAHEQGATSVAVAVWLLAAGGALWLALRERLTYLPASLLVLSAAYAGWSAGILYDGREQGIALLVIAATFVASSAAVFFRDRDSASLLWAIALTLGAIGAASLTSGATLTIVWATEAAVLAWLAWRIDEPRFQLGSLAWLTLAFGHALAVDAPLTKLFDENDSTLVAALSAAALAAGTALAGRYTFEWEPREEGLLAPILCRLGAVQRHLRRAEWWLAGAAALYSASLAVVTLPASWDWGHVAVAALWSLVAVALAPTRLRTASIVVVGAAATLAWTYDVVALAETPRSWSLAIVATALLVVAVVHELRSRLRIEPFALVAHAVSAASAGAAVVELLDGRVRGAALLALAGGYALVGVGVLHRRRDFASALGIVALVIAVPALAILLSDTWLVLALAATAAAHALLARFEDRLAFGALGYLALALAHTLVFEAPPTDLFVAHRHPGAGAGAVVLVALGTAVLGYVAPRLRRALSWIGGGLALYAATLAILELFEASGGGVATSFQRGHTAVSALWGGVGLALLVAGLKRGSRSLRLGGLALFGASLAKLFLYDLANLSSVARALSFLAVGAVLLVGGFFYQRLTAEPPPDLHSPA
jgi:uncharacterized membrane protein